MKTFAVCMLAASAAALDMEFFRGCQQGVFVMNDEQIYTDCPQVVDSPQIENMKNMAKPAIMMMQNMNQGKPIPGVEYLEAAVDELAMLYGVFYGYEGSEFCKGKIVSHEIAKFCLNAGRKEAAKFFPMLDKDALN